MDLGRGAFTQGPYVRPSLHRGAGMKLTSPEATARFFKLRLRLDVEEFWVAALNPSLSVLASQCLFRGTVDQCPFYPRDVLRFACLHNASQLVVAHGHPSGDPRPSAQDLEVTAQLGHLAALIEIPLVDHVIVSHRRYFSFLASGRLPTIQLKDPGDLAVRALGRY